ncbi:MAG TPA: GntR family transcriptional regulator [Yinghuangia sp.]|uniref:GntR family transcriptional regulator n=1 Tax=Yinghuangia sp. YIM S10712 TaxID=3436930 RepID=UPI002CE6266B|nr:GntR family transcriptional regulator [Yinghuangia sp.]
MGRNASARQEAQLTANPVAESAAREPKYYRLKMHLLELTRTQPPGTPVPPERTLAGDFDISRSTVRQALGELVIEGRLERVQGRGTFVAKPKVAHRLRLGSYTEDVRAQGLEPASRILGAVRLTADVELAERLGITPGSRALRIERLRLADAEPVALETTHLAAGRFPGLDRALDRHMSLRAALREVYGVRLAETEEVVETALASPREASLLATDVGMPLLALSRHSFDADGTPVEWTRAVYRGDRCKFRL